MAKRGLVGMIILGVFVFLLVAGLLSGIYFYNYYVFKEIRVCVGDWKDTGFPCMNREACLSAMNFSSDAVEGAPVFIRENFDNIMDSAVYCEDSCFVGTVRGIDYVSGELEELESCVDGEDEFVMEIKGKEGAEILAWMKDRV